MSEIWKPVKTDKVDFTGRYEVSNFENVRNSKTKKVLKKSFWGEYHRICLQNGKVSNSYHLHRLVCFAFPEICGEYFEGATVNHKDENKTNNKPDNLEWITQKENNVYGTRLQRCSETNTNNHKREKPIVQLKNGLPFFIWKSAAEASTITSYPIGSIRWALSSKKQCKGFTWKYLDNQANLQ